MESERLREGDIVRHFKRELYLKRYDKIEEEFRYSACYNDSRYLYEVLDTNVKHTETGERMVLYRALYCDDDKEIDLFQRFVRPYSMFMGKVDHKKYPDVKQEYRFERDVDNKWYREKGQLDFV